MSNKKEYKPKVKPLFFNIEVSDPDAVEALKVLREDGWDIEGVIRDFVNLEIPHLAESLLADQDTDETEELCIDCQEAEEREKAAEEMGVDPIVFVKDKGHKNN